MKSQIEIIGGIWAAYKSAEFFGKLSAIQDTVYPRISSNLDKTMLQKHFQLSTEEISLLKQHSYDLSSRIGLALLLKTFQYLGYFRQLHQLLLQLIDYVYTNN